MTKDQARRWLEKREYRVVLQMGSYPSPSYYMAIPKGSWGRTHRGSLNSIVNEIRASHE